jgi:hypothetical protein
LRFTSRSNPPGNYPAVINRADIRGTQKTFRENQTYCGSTSFIDSNKNLTFQGNRYLTCGANGPSWTFDDHTYDMFDKYRAATGQEEGSSWESASSATCLSAPPSQHKKNSDAVAATKNRRIAHGTMSPNWTVVSELLWAVCATAALRARSSAPVQRTYGSATRGGCTDLGFSG